MVNVNKVLVIVIMIEKIKIELEMVNEIFSFSINCVQNLLI